jgi:iron(III) transport system substrate-binding protein
MKKLWLTGLIVLLPSFLWGGTIDTKEGRPAWRAEWERTVEAAKKEGQVSIYGTDPLLLITDSGVFQKAYPGIKIVTVAPGTGNQAMQRLVAERRAGKYLADIIIGGAGTPVLLYQSGVLDPIRPSLILPEVIDESRWWKGRHRYNDPEEQYVFQYIGHPQIGNISYNAQLVEPKAFKSFWDFVNPKWKGKIEVRDFRARGAGNNNMKFIYYNPELGPKYIRHLFGEMDITIFRDTRQSVDWLATGKFALCFFCYPQELARAQMQGLPVAEFETVMKEGAAVVSHSGSIGTINKAPHPNAARVFVNWLLSREGQLTMQRVYVEGRRGASNSLRVDIPKDMVPPHERLLEGVNYMDLETRDRSDAGPIIKLVEEVLAAKERKR